ncbi:MULTISPECIES: alpha/beta hydrolase [unclassified Mucilaginibacter]|uniref:alpha/beta fold hydrolase n=1 Tax=unclassified Mucilaginibacter TaxID=2617802 RepID=UPI002AC97650|nr:MULTISPECIES: alpha/beta hydrolase [unclassified Mucilaginibacter]MEB0260253.1 alpha/beta hydrolase [Mucilaginibacter sp. 10I4]MEB0277336.1 alpha/beta hydrolase [Mucilaginibacter sp. 10B2]MEB0300182.1 alpha/beta hydrolase [Mucilaginibacter sp. 5C4]WPX25461.1 alpha/beta hydrolase [Mucilaginibacter sp. 5C4]
MKTLCLLLVALLWPFIFACNSPQKKLNLTSKVSLISNNVRIDYTDTGKGDTTLLFVHGWAINKTYWANQVAYFGKRYRVVTIDLPGFGKSDKNRAKWNTAAYGQDIKNVISQLSLKNVILIGHSMAGSIVLQGAIDAPGNVIALVGVDNFKSVGIASTDSVKDKQEYAKAIAAMKKNFKVVAFEWFNQGLFYKTTSKAIRERILNDVAHTDSTVAIATQEWDDFNDAAALLKAKKKLYLINSDYQPTDTTGLVAKKIPYKLLIVHDTGHFPMVEKPEEFNKLLDEVIADLRY